ncbi:hypothetical protein MMQ12_24160 [Klebsiella pneumoniae]|uniref:hypothetical protein n=1 Tax=Klebsiella pneumoniae TaxID=573 RepID=UPI001F4EA1F9|nr:hypothetical protein [Klebsiella pneumoniae]MCH9576291.1 hypothetical protein [Klebsiella pneumoniae]
MTSKLTRERVFALIAEHSYDSALVDALEHLLAAMDSEPVAYIFKHPAGRLFWALTDESNKGQSDVMPVYAEPQPAPAFPDFDNVLESLDYEVRCNAWESEHVMQACQTTYDACRAAMLERQLVDHVDEKSLTSINPAPDLVYLQKKAESIIGNYPGIPDCWCRTCRPVVLNDMRFVVCPDCGNKRCPRANDHRNACTGSNEPGQEGSAFPDTPREVKGE